jgi:3-oxoacyl-[acyl-carrier-protein] synthase II
VVVTGLGAITPIGLDVASAWQACLEGRTGTRALDHPWLDREAFRTHVGSPVVGFDLTERGFPARDLKTLDKACWYALAATKEAFESARLDLLPADREGSWRVEGIDADRCVTVVSSGVGGLSAFEAAHGHWVRHGNFRGSAWLRMSLPMLIPNAPTANVAIRFGLRGECKALPTACAAGAMSIGDAFRLIRGGEADVAACGGTDAVLTDHDGLGLMGFDVLKVMSARNEDPAHASRPFDRDRDGFVLGEGAAVLVLEEEAHARARGAPILAEVLGYATTCDAHDMMQPDPSGRMVQRAFELALRDAGVSPADVEHVNAHATATPAGDRVEASVLRRVFGTGGGAPLVCATKSLTGHCIGASGAIEAMATVLALRDGVVHATQNLEHVEPECELNHVVGGPARAALRVAASSSLGFGGHDAVLVFAKA